MKALFQLEFARLSKQRSSWVIFSMIFLLGGLNVLLARLTAYEMPNGQLEFFLNSRSILQSSFQLGQFQILLIGIITSLFIASDINQGTIRNKIIAGYSKSEIYTTQMAMSAMLAVLGLALFHSLPAAFAWLITFPITQDDGGSFAQFAIHMGFGYLLVVVGVLITSWISLRAKNTAGAIIFTLLVFVLGPTLTMIIKSIIEASTLSQIDQFQDPSVYEEAYASIQRVFEWVYFDQLNRLNNAGSLLNFNIQPLNFFNESSQPYIYKTLASSATLIGLLVGLGGRQFAKSDLK
jgi:hypothetical protein